MRFIYITHPQVSIDPEVEVTRWSLSKAGRQRAQKFAAHQHFDPNTLYISSTEKKAVDLAQILSGNRDIITDDTLGENDRSATGYLPKDAFEKHADAFFAAPETSIKGWESAFDAQSRVVLAVTRHIADLGSSRPSTVVFCGHGAVGTLLLCHLAEREIRRREDQSVRADGGGGNLFQFDLAPNRLLCEWTAMEDWKGFSE